MKKFIVGLLALCLIRVDAIAIPAFEFGSQRDTVYDARRDVFLNTTLRQDGWCLSSPTDACVNPVEIPAKRKFIFSLRLDLFDEKLHNVSTAMMVLGSALPVRSRGTLDKIGSTPLIQFAGDVPNNNRIWLKLECENPFGSHYDRVYPRLFEHFEQQGTLKPGCTVLETSTGSAGVSFAGIGRILGYKCLVAIPAGTENAREEAIRNEGAELILTPAEKYVNGFPQFVKRFLVKNRDVVFLNHSMGPLGTENRVVVKALGGIATELQSQLGSVDCFVAAVGNGSSVLGPGRVLAPQTHLVTFESFQSGVAYELLYPGEYERVYGIRPGSLPRHKLYGTSYPGIDFPHIRIALQEEQLVKETMLVSDRVTDEQYRLATGRDIPATLPRWDAHQLHPYGRTTRAGLSVALKIAERMQDKNIVLIAYDKEDRYDS